MRAHYEEELERAWREDRGRWAEMVIAKEIADLVEVARKIAEDVHEIAQSTKGIYAILKPKFPVRGIFSQGDSMVTGTIKGLVPGASDTFFVTPVDVNGNADALPAGSPVPTFSADDASVVLAPSTDGLSVVATAAAGATVGGSFNLNWSASYTNPAGTVVNITATANVPYLAPPALLPVGGVISQGSPAGSAVTAFRKK